MGCPSGERGLNMPKVIREVPTEKYPRLMESRNRENLIVYFFEEGDGIVLSSPDDDHFLFFVSKNWEMDEFKPFEGKVVFP